MSTVFVVTGNLNGRDFQVLGAFDSFNLADDYMRTWLDNRWPNQWRYESEQYQFMHGGEHNLVAGNVQEFAINQPRPLWTHPASK